MKVDENGNLQVVITDPPLVFDEEGNLVVTLDPPLSFDAETGNQAVTLDPPLQFDLDGNLRVTPRIATSDTATPPLVLAVGVAPTLALDAHPDAKGRLIQNVGITTLYLGLDAIPTALSYHVALKASVAEGDGSGGRWEGIISGTLWTGVVNVIGSADSGYAAVVELS